MRWALYHLWSKWQEISYFGIEDKCFPYLEIHEYIFLGLLFYVQLRLDDKIYLSVIEEVWRIDFGEI